LFSVWNGYVDLIEWCLRFLTDYTTNMGVSIILFTIFLKTVILPLTIKSIRSTAAMQELQPKIKELQKKHSKDRAKVTEETMKLYQEYQINPAAGCLPMLIQIPIFFGLYYAVRHVSGDGGGFLWIENLGKADPYKILPITAGVFQFAQTRMMRPANKPAVTDPQQQMMNTMMNFMPLMVVVFGWTFASGAVLYWATQALYSVVQQWFITGWGSLGAWFPFLPELPEHRRLGHRKPLEPQEITGEPKGLMAKMQKRALQMEEQKKQAAAERSQAAPARPTGGKRQAKVGNVSGGAAPVDPKASRVMTGRTRSTRDDTEE
jgi:YidC/Oxa1 family membrane protein insertase